MANESTLSSEPFLKVPCRHYLETMIRSYDVLRSELHNHIPFFVYWSECVETKPSALNAMLYAFKYCDRSENESIDKESAKKAEDYLEALIKYYNSEYPDKAFGKHVAQFIRGFKSKTGRTGIKAEDFKWFPQKWQKEMPDELKAISKEVEYIAKEFDFAWKCARLWQLLEERKQVHYILSFLGITETKFTETSNIPFEISSKLNETTIEEPEYLKGLIDYFTPEQMTKHDMSLLLKKACHASIREQQKDGIKEIYPSNARIKPLDSLWLLTKFYRIHHYRLDFIGQKMPPRAIKQFVGIGGDSPFLDWDEKSLDKIINNGSVKVGKRKYPLAEVLMTIYTHKELFNLLEHKSNEIIEGKERNPYIAVRQIVREENSISAAISHIDLSNDLVRKLIKEYQGVFKAMMFSGSFFSSKYETLLEKNVFILEKNKKNKILKNIVIDTMITEGLESAKNVFFITEDDFDNWDLLVAFIIYLCFYFKTVNKLTNKREAKRIVAPS